MNGSDPPEGQAAVQEALAALASAGLDEETLAAATAEGFEGLRRMVARYLTFPGERRYTPPEVMERSGVDDAMARALWRAMGFAEAADDERAFTDADVDAVRGAAELLALTDMDAQVLLQQARVMSQGVARIAASQMDVIGELLQEEDPIRSASRAFTLAEEALPALDRLLLFMYRRHLAAAAEQFLLMTSAERGEAELSVGFADLTGFTVLSQEIDTRELASLVERFNGVTSDAVARNGGRIVKTIGDEVMFSAHDAASAAAIALEHLDAISPEHGFPPLRVGLATGSVVVREGDVFGVTVNLASRLVAAARPGSALVDPETRDALSGDDRFDLKAIPPHTLKGFGRVRAYRLRSRV